MGDDKKSKLAQILPDQLSVLRGSVAIIPFIGGLLDHLCFDRFDAIKIKNLQQGFASLAEQLSIMDEIKLDINWLKSEEAFSIIEDIIKRIDRKSTECDKSKSLLSPSLTPPDRIDNKDSSCAAINRTTRKQNISINAAIKHLEDNILKIFSELENKLTSKSIRILVNQILLRHACEAYLIDVERYKNSHMVTMLARHKHAAFLFKWLTRMRPVSILSCKADLEVYMTLHINTYFSLMAVLVDLDVDINEFAHTQIAQQIIYAASYHAVTPESWMPTFYLLENKFSLS